MKTRTRATLLAPGPSGSSSSPAAASTGEEGSGVASRAAFVYLYADARSPMLCGTWDYAVRTGRGGWEGKSGAPITLALSLCCERACTPSRRCGTRGWGV